MNSTLKTLYGLKFNPFLPGLPTEVEAIVEIRGFAIS
jgi:hypothetical protein